MPRLEVVWADGAYAGENLGKWCEEHTGWLLQIVPRNVGRTTFEVLTRRWVVERDFAWASRFGRLVKDYERLPATVAGLHFVALACLFLHRAIPVLASSL